MVPGSAIQTWNKAQFQKAKDEQYSVERAGESKCSVLNIIVIWFLSLRKVLQEAEVGTKSYFEPTAQNNHGHFSFISGSFIENRKYQVKLYFQHTWRQFKECTNSKHFIKTAADNYEIQLMLKTKLSHRLRLLLKSENISWVAKESWVNTFVQGTF